MFPKNVLRGMCNRQFLKRLVVTLKMQSKVEHWTRIAFLLDFLTSTQART